MGGVEFAFLCFGAPDFLSVGLLADQHHGLQDMDSCHASLHNMPVQSVHRGIHKFESPH